MNSYGIGFIVLLFAALGAGFLVFSGGDAPERSAPAERSFELVIEGRTLIEGPQTLTVQKGDIVTIRATADEDEEVHLHGYDRSVDLVANEPAELQLRADTAGRFLIELEASKIEIAALEVRP